MLCNLDISNIAVIEKLSFEPGRGMTVLTGETGAGKSVIIDSVNMVLGARANKALIRYGTDRARVSAMFTADKGVCDILAENGIEPDEEIVITREVTSDGKSIARINGVMVPAGVLRDISHLLINIHGQHDNQALLNPSKHIVFLDGYAENQKLLSEYRSLYYEMREYEKELDALNKNEQDRLARIDLLKYQTEELSRAKLLPGEEEELKEESLIMANSEKITLSVGNAFDVIYENENNAYDLLNGALTQLAAVTGFDERLSAIYERLSDASYAIEDAAHELRAYLDTVEFNPDRMEELSERLDLIKRLERKYGPGIGECLDYLKKAQSELDGLLNSDEKSEELIAKISAVKKKLSQCAKKLTASREEAAQRLSGEIEKELHELDMERAVFKAELKTVDEFNINGCDSVEFVFSANPGQPPKELSEIASGGELSRVMLAMKTVLAETDEVDTLIFDEIDTGVSGSAAQKIAKKLSRLGKTKQVICISHQPMLAAAADYNYKIEKNVKDNITSTSIRLLSEEERICELARIIDGNDITNTSLEHAREMLDKAKKM